MGDRGDENIAKLVVIILVAIVYAVATGVRKLNRWINEKRERRAAGEMQPPRPDFARPGAREPAREQAAPKAPPEPPIRDAAASLLRELEKALSGEFEIEERKPASPPPPLPPPPAPPVRPSPAPVAAPSMARQIPPLLAPQRQGLPPPYLPARAVAAQQTQVSAAFRAPKVSPHRKLEPPRAVTPTRIHVLPPAAVQRARLDHLAVLRSPADLQRGILLHEILGPPRAFRSLRVSGSPLVRKA
jgi:hypothetical protein